MSGIIGGAGSKSGVIGELLVEKQYDLAMSSSNWTKTSALGIPYKTIDGAWRLRFNILGSTTVTSSFSLTISGVVFTGNDAVSITTDGGTRLAGASYTNAGAATFLCVALAGVSLGTVKASGDVRLNSKPTWAD